MQKDYLEISWKLLKPYDAVCVVGQNLVVPCTVMHTVNFNERNRSCFSAENFASLILFRQVHELA